MFLTTVSGAHSDESVKDFLDRYPLHVLFGYVRVICSYYFIICPPSFFLDLDLFYHERIVCVPYFLKKKKKQLFSIRCGRTSVIICRLRLTFYSKLHVSKPIKLYFL